MRIGYFDALSGASGDMILGSLVSAGLPLKQLTTELKKLKIKNWNIGCKNIVRNGIDTIKLYVTHQHVHIKYSKIKSILSRSSLEKTVKQKSLAIFENLAKTESRLHRIGIDELHFHELGSPDTIIDICGAVIGFSKLGIKKIYFGPVNVGSGTINISHGTMPVPPPAVAELMKGFLVYSDKIKSELFTPTAAAIFSTLGEQKEFLPKINIEKIGYGSGDKEFKELPNYLRIIIGKSEAVTSGSIIEDLILIETNLDDSTPELIGYVIDRLLEERVLDVFTTPIYMKKNRPAFKLSVLIRPDQKDKISEFLFQETTTLGLRYMNVERECLPVKFGSIKTKFGKIPIKSGIYRGKVINTKPEFEALRKLSSHKKIPLKNLIKLS